MELETLEKALKKSWAKETCYPPMKKAWFSDRPCLGQCLVTALVVTHYMGWSLCHCVHENHYWNILPDGQEVDLTIMQFKDKTKLTLDSIYSVDEVMAEPHFEANSTRERYHLLLQRVEKALADRL